jgi:hypothetical protein
MVAKIVLGINNSTTVAVNLATWVKRRKWLLLQNEKIFRVKKPKFVNIANS